MVKESEPVELGFSTDAAVIVTELTYEFGAVYVIVAVSPFPELPTFVGLVSVPQPGEHAFPPLVNVQVAPKNCWLLWTINAVKTCCCPAGTEAACVCSVSVVVFPPPPTPIPQPVRKHTAAKVHKNVFIFIPPSAWLKERLRTHRQL
jgi:hypothetical protein